jgi:hypothetical protein
MYQKPFLNAPVIKFAQVKWSGFVCILCLLFQSATATAQTTAVVPIDWGKFKKGNPKDSLSLLERDVLLNAIRYGLTTWYNEVKKFGAQQSEYLDFGGIGEHNIRATGSEALAIAVALKTGVYNGEKTGLPAGKAKEIALKLTKSGAFNHKANKVGGWGDHWQSALWAAYSATAGWLLWDDLSVKDRIYVQKMVEYEANRFNNFDALYMRDRNGKEIFKGDSKSEENSWNSMILQIAVAMMPNHPNYKIWMDKNIELQLSASARPEDLKSEKVYHGKKIKDILKGSNYNDDGTVINHGRIHPDYMACTSQTYFNVLLFALAGKPAPKASLFNTDVIFKTLVDFKFTSPPFLAPGGTIYRSGTAEVYYPQTNDWGRGRKMHFALLDCQAAAFGMDKSASKNGAYWESLHANAVLKLQARSKDGRSYIETIEDTYLGREEWVAVQAAQAYLTKWLVFQKSIKFTNQAY